MLKRIGNVFSNNKLKWSLGTVTLLLVILASYFVSQHFRKHEYQLTPVISQIDGTCYLQTTFSLVAHAYCRINGWPQETFQTLWNRIMNSDDWRDKVYKFFKPVGWVYSFGEGGHVEKLVNSYEYFPSLYARTFTSIDDVFNTIQKGRMVEINFCTSNWEIFGPSDTDFGCHSMIVENIKKENADYRLYLKNSWGASQRVFYSRKDYLWSFLNVNLQRIGFTDVFWTESSLPTNLQGKTSPTQEEINRCYVNAFVDYFYGTIEKPPPAYEINEKWDILPLSVLCVGLLLVLIAFVVCFKTNNLVQEDKHKVLEYEPFVEI